MRLVNAAQLAVVIRQSPAVAAIVSQTNERDWVLILRVRNRRSELLEDYQLLTVDREIKRWKDPRAIFRLLNEHYGIQHGTFQMASHD